MKCKEINCNNEICYSTWKYGKGRCRSCAGKNKPPYTKGHKQKISRGRKNYLKKNKKEIMGKNNPNYKGKTKNSDGYIYIYLFSHPFKTCRNQILEHKLIVEKYLSRYLEPEWVVHHINKIKDDNRIENLMCFVSNSAHQRFHKDLNNVKDSEIIFDGRKLILDVIKEQNNNKENKKLIEEEK